MRFSAFHLPYQPAPFGLVLLFMNHPCDDCDEFFSSQHECIGSELLRWFSNSVVHDLVRAFCPCDKLFLNFSELSIGPARSLFFFWHNQRGAEE